MNAPLPAAPPLAQASISEQATDMLDLMMRLSELLAHETELLRSGRLPDIEPLQREKMRLTLLYQKALKALASAGTTASTLPAPLRAQFVAASGRLADAVGENERALRIGRAATRRLLDAIVESVQARLKPLRHYDARSRTATNITPLALAVDRRL
jgi:hypothetical protein